MYRTNAYPVSHLPRRNSIALGVTALVLVGLATVGSLGYVVYRAGVRRGAVAIAETPKAGPTALPVPAPTESAPGSKVPPDDDDDDPMTVAPTSHVASRKARPPWARFEDHVAGKSTTQFAPQPSDALDMFLRSAPMSALDNAKLDGAYVICRVQSFNKHDSFAGDDLHVRAKLGSMPEVAQDGPEDANLGFVSAPLVTLERGDTLKFEVYDRDVFGMAPITRATTTFRAPFNYVDEGAAIECRSLVGAPLHDAVKSYGARADAKVAKLAKAHVDPYSPDWTADHFDQAHAERAIGDVAALVGWADARTVKRVQRLDAAKATLDAQRDQAFVTLHDAARDRVTFDRFDVRLGAVDCAGKDCTIHLSVTNHDKHETLHFGAFLSPSAYVADAQSRPIRTTGSGDVGPGATQEIVVGSTGADLTNGPSIVGICKGSRCAPLLVR